MAQLNWQQVPGGLVQVSAAGSAVWGVNARDEIYRYNGTAQWDRMEGAASQVSVGWDGSVWCVNRAGNIFRFLGKSWQQMPGAATSISVHNYNNVWVTNAAGHIYNWNGHDWRQVDGAATQISVGKDGTVGCVNAGQNIYIRPGGVNGAWQQLPGAATQISVHKHNSYGVVNAAGHIYIWVNGNWQHANGEGHSIALARGHKNVWVVNAKSNNIYQHNVGGSSKSHYHGYNWQQFPGGLVKVAGAGKNIWGINANDQIFRYNGTPQWDRIDGAACDISVGWDGSVWVVNRGGNIYRWLGSSWGQVEGALVSVAVRSFNDVWGCNAGGNIYHWNGLSWTQVDGQCSKIAVGKDGTVACVNAGGNIYIRDGLHGAWHQLPGAAVGVAVHKKDTLAVVNAAGHIYTWHNGNWVQAAGEGHSIAMPRGHKEVWVVNAKSSNIYVHRG